MAFHRFILIPFVFAVFAVSLGPRTLTGGSSIRINSVCFSLFFAVSLGPGTLTGVHQFILIPFVFACFCGVFRLQGSMDSYGLHPIPHLFEH